jgi:hypothetical protein
MRSEGSFVAHIHLKRLEIHAVSNVSGVFSGQNVQHKWRYSNKQNEGFGTFTGNANVATEGVNALLDSDGIDQWVKQTVVEST